MTDIIYYTVLNYLLFNLAYYVPSLVLFVIDYLNLFSENKIQRRFNPIDYYKKIYPTVLLNTLIFCIPGVAILAYFESQVQTPFTISRFLFDMITSLILTDILFYSAHKLFHLPFLYKRFHKKHHQIIAPIGFSAIYMTVPDLYIGSIIPVYLPLILLQAHPLTISLWIVFTTANTVLISHSGFEGLSNFHDSHHLHFNKNFGINILMDKLFRTIHIPCRTLPKI